MMHKVKDLSSGQKLTIEGLLGRTVDLDETVSVRAIRVGDTPEWLDGSWESARRLGVDALSMDEIDAEIDAARKTRRSRSQPVGQ